jgi:hypothetical protein
MLRQRRYRPTRAATRNIFGHRIDQPSTAIFAGPSDRALNEERVLDATKIEG